MVAKFLGVSLFFDLLESDKEIQSNEKPSFAPTNEMLMMICAADSALTKKGATAMYACAEKCESWRKDSLGNVNPNICPTASKLMMMVKKRYACETCNFKEMGWNAAKVYQMDVKTLPEEISNDLELTEVHLCAYDFSRNALGFGECMHKYNEKEQRALYRLLKASGRYECFISKFQVSCKSHAARILGKMVSGSDEQNIIG